MAAAQGSLTHLMELHAAWPRSFVTAAVMIGGCALLWAWAVVLWVRGFSRLAGVPGPLPLPGIGHLYLKDVTQIMKLLASMRKRYGSVFHFWPGPEPILVVAESTDVRQILTDVTKFPKGADYTNKFSVVFGNGLVTSNGARHKKDRGCLNKFFVRSQIEKQQQAITEQTTEAIDEFLEPKVGEEVDIAKFFHMLALRIFGRFSVSHDYAKDPCAETINHIVCWGSHVIGEHIVLGIPVWDVFPRVRKLKKCVQVVHDHVNTLIDARVALQAAAADAASTSGAESEAAVAAAAAVPDDSLSAMLEAKMERQDIVEQLTTLLSAGHDTTAFFGCYMVHLLAQHPRVQQKLKDEIRDVLGAGPDAPGVDPSKPILPEHVHALKYVRCVLQEVLRMYPVIPNLTRNCVADTTLNTSGVTVKAGTRVLVSNTLLNRDARVWENPGEFQPERFAELCTSSAGFNSAKHGYMPFGYGSRTCIGNTLAMIEGTIMCTLLMQRYTVEPAPGFKPRIVPGISMVSENGIKVILKRDASLTEGGAL